MWLRLDQGWVAHDDGAFAQMATRVLDGELPHREFVDLYTGGMTFLNAATMSLFGEDIVVLRYPLFVVYLGLFPASYYIARRLSGPWTALAVAALVCTWSVPVYPAPMPSWYILAFTIYAAACLLRWRDTGNDRWLFGAGVLAGLAVAFKITGVYLVVAILLFLVFVHPRKPRTSVVSRWPELGAIVLVVGLLASVLGSRLGAREIVNLALPVVAVTVAVVVERGRRLPSSVDGSSDSALVRCGAVFFGGVLVPLAALGLPYVVAGAVGDFVEGVLVSPQARRDVAYWATPPVPSIALALLLGVLLFAMNRLPHAARRVVGLTLAAAAIAGLVAAGFVRDAYLTFWVTGRGMGVIVVLVGTYLLVRKRAATSPARRDIVFLLLALAALTSLVQFPFGIAVYYCYAAPLVGLAAVGVLSQRSVRAGWVPAVLIAAFALYGALYMDRAMFADLAGRFIRDGQVEILDPGRASIRVRPEEAAATRRVVGLLRRHSRGEYVFAGPDSPQLYFLADLRNPTRSLFDFLDTTDSARGKELLARLDDKDVTAIAINRSPELSEPLDAPTLRQLVARYPNVERVGSFDVRWKD
jgi:4-amino-4-deoxy-L-arabinose transferase-like glycosyltransferase